jgi:hypothetical protein
VSIVRTRDSSRWKEVIYKLFDAPDVVGGFEKRMAHCQALVTSLGDHVEWIAHTLCKVGFAHHDCVCSVLQC